MEKRNFETKLEKFLTGKGFYIVLFLCIAIIGVSAWIMLFSDDETDDPGATAVINGQDIDVLAEQPELPTKSDEADTPVDEPEDEDTIVPDMDTVQTVVDEPKEEPVTPPADTTPNEEKPSEPAATVSAPTAYIWPVSGEIVGEYSVDALVYNKTMEDWRTHNGVDIAAELGAKVRAVADGTVAKVFVDDLFGTTVVIDHGAGICSVYSNMAGTPTVKEGDKVSLGDVIGSVGNTAIAESSEVTHLHFAMNVNSASADPLDYMPPKLS